MKHYKMIDVVSEVSVRENNPSASDYDRFVGLEHYVSGEVEITNYGSTANLDSAMKVFQAGDILVARRNVYLKRASVVFFNGLTSGDSIVLRAKDDRIARLLPFVLNTEAFWDYADQHSDGTMSKRLSPKTLMQYEFVLPDDDQRDYLAETLWAAAETKASYQRLMTRTDELVKSQFIEMFGNSAVKKQGWPIMTMKEAAIRLSDGPFGSNLKSEHYRENGIRVIRLQNICDGYFLDEDKAYISDEHYERIKKYTCHAGEIVIGTLGDPNLRACIIPDSIEIAINKADCVHYIPKSDLLDNQFVCGYVNSPQTLALALGNAHGNTRQRISSGQIAQLPIVIPPMELQRQYAEFVQQTDKTKFELKQAIESVSSLIKALMQQDFSNSEKEVI